MNNLFKGLVVGLLALGLSACGSSKTAGDAPANFQGIEYPDWVLKGSGAYGGDSGRVFCTGLSLHFFH